MSRVRGIRGATTAGLNSKEAILEATRELLQSLVDANQVQPDDVAAAFFTTTEDLNAEYPAMAARQMGWQYVALIDVQQMKVPDEVARCIRVLLLVNTDKTPKDLVWKYLRGASGLRQRGMEV